MTQFLGEIRLVGFAFAPEGWALCQGQTLSIAQETALFSLLGTTYGGDGVQTFNLPDLRGRVIVHQGQGNGLSPYVLGGVGGVESVTLTSAQMPYHTHALNAAPSGTTATPGPGVILGTPIAADLVYASQGTLTPTPLSGNSIGVAGGSQPHENRQPLLTLSYIIAMTGIFPSRS